MVIGIGVTWGMTPGGSIEPDYYIVYRTKMDGASGTERQILRIPNTTALLEETLVDVNDYLPGTTSAFLFQQNLENMSFKQLAPMMKIPLATVDTSIRWSQVLFGVPQLYTPGKNVLYINVGRSVGYVGQP